MTTIGDMFDNFLSSYIRKTPSKEEKIVEDSLPFKPSDYGEESNKFSMEVAGSKLTPVLRRKMALTTPFYMKGLRKKCRDTFRAGWDYVKEGNRPPQVELTLLKEFNKRNNILAFLDKMKQDAHVYGDGICLVVFANDQKTKKPDLSKKPNKSAIPYTLKRMNPEFITKYEYVNDYYRKLGIQHLVYDNVNSGQKIYIHPDRVLMFKETEFAFTKFGISDIDILRHVISSQADIDIATGEILKWFSYGVIHWTKSGASKNTMKEMRKVAEKHPHIYIGDETYDLDIQNPESIDPSPFYDYLIMSIAAVLVMPVHVLKGVEVGQTTGAEAGYADYHKDIRDSQELIYKPQLEKLYKMLFNAYFDDRVFDYEVMFNPTYVGEMAEAEVDAKRAATVVNLKTADIIDLEEAREYMNEGHIPLDKSKEIEQKEKNPKEQIQPNPRTSLPVPKKEKEDKSLDNKLKATEKLIDDTLFENSGVREQLLQELRIKKAKDD